MTVGPSTVLSSRLAHSGQVPYSLFTGLEGHSPYSGLSLPIPALTSSGDSDQPLPTLSFPAFSPKRTS